MWQIHRFVKDTGSSGFLPFKSGHLSALVILAAAGILVLWLLPCHVKEEMVSLFKDACRGLIWQFRFFPIGQNLGAVGYPITGEAGNVCEVCILQSFLLS